MFKATNTRNSRSMKVSGTTIIHAWLADKILDRPDILDIQDILDLYPE